MRVRDLPLAEGVYDFMQALLPVLDEIRGYSSNHEKALADFRESCDEESMKETLAQNLETLGDYDLAGV